MNKFYFLCVFYFMSCHAYAYDCTGVIYPGANIINVYASDIAGQGKSVTLPPPNMVCNFYHNHQRMIVDNIYTGPSLTGVSGSLTFQTNSVRFPFPSKGACLMEHDSQGQCIYPYTKGAKADFTPEIAGLDNLNLNAGTELVTIKAMYCDDVSSCPSNYIWTFTWVLKDDFAGGGDWQNALYQAANPLMLTWVMSKSRHWKQMALMQVLLQRT